jgi:transposase
MTQQRRFTKDFEDEAVRLVGTSGRSQREIADDLGIGLLTLVRWISRSRDRQVDVPDRSGQEDAAAELKRLRRENEIPRQERDILKRTTAFRSGRKSVRFALIDAAKEEFPMHHLCRVLGVSQSGSFAWKGRPACRRQHEDMVLLAHVRSAFALSNGTYGSPRTTWELQNDSLAVGHRRRPA